MRRLTAYVSGKVQRCGYRGKVVAIARAFGLKGTVQNPPDGRMLVETEGEDADLERFADALVMKNALIDVTGIEKRYGPVTAGLRRFAEGAEDDMVQVMARIGRESNISFIIAQYYFK